MPNQNHRDLKPGLVSGVYPNQDHPNTLKDTHVAAPVDGNAPGLLASSKNKPEETKPEGAE